MPGRALRQCRDLAGGLLGLAYPEVCAGCEMPLGFAVPQGGGEEADAGPLARAEDEAVAPRLYPRWLCASCESRLQPVEPPFCSLCGNTFFGRATVEFCCSNCSQRRLWFDFARGAYRGEGLTRELIHRFKYNKGQELRGLLGAMLGQALATDPRLGAAEAEGWALTPVPLHWWRHRTRGYNQAWELCRTLRRQFPGLALAPVLRRVRRTTTQASLQRDDRLKNLRGAFALSLWPWRRGLVTGKTVLLVDDVLTTGATLSECARVLIEQAQATRVIAITLARG